jgi:alkanesulfonate monooxygenase SsuD/methylene tetrahydromethanopterin reductase-like flavin-dependent oxidoreductase (luciferase family)
VRYALDIPNFGAFSDVRSVADLAGAADASGWDGFFIWDHLAPGVSAVDPTVALTAIALATDRVRFGPLVTPIPRRRVQKLARETVTLDHASNGRLVLGVGLGYPPDGEYAAFGEPSSDRERAERLDESLAVLTALWTGEAVDYDGRHLHVHTPPFKPVPLQRPRVPIWVAGGWPDARRAFRRAARYDGVYAMSSDPSTRFHLLPDEIRAMRDFIGRDDPEFEILATAVPGADPADYAAAGATWWVVVASTPADALRVVEEGPPRSN